LFIVGGVAGLLQLSSPFQFGGTEMLAEAKSLAEHGAFANPFDIANTGFTAVNPPLYPVVLALLMKVLTAPRFFMLAALVGNIVANALTAAWLPRMSFVFYGDAIPGAVAALLWLAAVQVMPAWDTSFTVAGVILFCLFSNRYIGRTDSDIRFGSAAGVAAGLLFLLNPSSAMISLPWIAYLFVHRRYSLERAGTVSAILLASLFLVVSPWLLRNYYQFGALVVRTNLGMTLYASNNDCAESSLAETERDGCYQTHHPNVSLTEAQLLRTLGEVNYDFRRTADAEAWAMANPARFWQLTGQRVRDFWLPPPEQHPYKTYVIWLATLLAIPGMILMIKRHKPVLAFLMAAQLIYPFMYYVVISDVRYRYPVLWLSLLPAGYFIRRISRVGLHLPVRHNSAQ